jgi:hypothetical protein
MYKKLISSILVVALLNLVGCYSSDLVTVTEYNQIEEENKPDDIRVMTKDSQEYHFSKSNFYIENDTLYGKGISLPGYEELPYEGKFAFEEIESIQTEHFSVPVSGFQKIEAKSGKPDEIYLTKLDSTRYHFMKDDYYIENDTLYGKGKLIIEKGQQLNRKIALSEIESIEVESFNTLNTYLLGLGILVVALILTIVIGCGITGKCGPH